MKSSGAHESNRVATHRHTAKAAPSLMSDGRATVCESGPAATSSACTTLLRSITSAVADSTLQLATVDRGTLDRDRWIALHGERGLGTADQEQGPNLRRPPAPLFHGGCWRQPNRPICPSVTTESPMLRFRRRVKGSQGPLHCREEAVRSAVRQVPRHPSRLSNGAAFVQQPPWECSSGTTRRVTAGSRLATEVRFAGRTAGSHGGCRITRGRWREPQRRSWSLPTHHGRTPNQCGRRRRGWRRSTTNGGRRGNLCDSHHGDQKQEWCWPPAVRAGRRRTGRTGQRVGRRVSRRRTRRRSPRPGCCRARYGQ